MKKVPANNPGLSKLPTKVRNRMGYKQAGGGVTETIKGNRGTKEQGMRAYDYEQQIKKEHAERMKYIEEQLSDNRGAKKKVNKKKGSRVNEAGNYTKPGMRKKIFERIKAGSKGGEPGQWSARKAQMMAKEYKAKGGGYKS